VSAGSRIKTATMIALGLLLGTIGLDTDRRARFTFGQAGLTGGLSFFGPAAGDRAVRLPRS